MIQKLGVCMCKYIYMYYKCVFKLKFCVIWKKKKKKEEED
jgi:hypothetical protein